MSKTNDYEVTFQPVGRTTTVNEGTDLLKAAQGIGIDLAAFCGGAGTCKKCIIKCISGSLSDPTSVEKAGLGEESIGDGYRLACQTFPRGNAVIYIPLNSMNTSQRLQLEGESGEIDYNPAVKGIEVTMDPPTLKDLRSDELRMEETLAPITLEHSVHSYFSDTLREEKWKVKAAVRDNRVIAVLPSGTKFYGLAIDYGTTSVAAYLVDLDDGTTLTKSGIMNPQIAYGEDVVTRITYSIQNEGGKELLMNSLIEATNTMIEKLCKEYKIEKEQIVSMTAVGNTAIHHLLHGLPVKQLGLAPYIPAVSAPMSVLASSLGINISSGAWVHTPGNIAGYVGADHVSMLLASGIHNEDKTILAIDIGTNTEMTLRHNNRFICCSCASGPAFEGAHLNDGMRAAPGAIEKVKIDGENIQLQTIDNKKPVGLCGSGILDVVAEMRRNNLINKMGKMSKDSPLIVGEGKESGLLLSPAAENGHGKDIIISKKDVNEIMLAKGAIRTGIEVLMELAGIKGEEIDEILIAGAFGTYIDIESAIIIKMLPELPRNRYRQIGNAAGMGAKEMLINIKKREEAAEIAAKVEYTELTNKKDFNAIFARAMLL